jgi:hypothetical protein
MFSSYFEDWTNPFIEELTVNEWFLILEFRLRIFHYGKESGYIDKKETDHRSDE